MYFLLAGKTVFSTDANGDPITRDLPIPDVPPGDYGAALIKMFLTLIAFVVLLFVTFWLLRRLVQSRLKKGVGADSIKIIEKKMISSKSMLYLVEVEGQKVLLAESQLEIRRLQTWREIPIPFDEESPPK
jgi:flagellar biogenesis protein FliO